MDKQGPFSVLLELSDPVERAKLEEAFRDAGLGILPSSGARWAAKDQGARLGRRPAPDPSLGERYDAALVDLQRWPELRGFFMPGPEHPLPIILLDPALESESPRLLGEGAFDYLLRGGSDFARRTAAYFKALGALRKRFTGTFGALERRYEDLVHALPDIVYELDSNGCFSFINNSVRLLGYDPSELLGKHFAVLLHDDDVAAVDRESVLNMFRGSKTGSTLSPKLFNERRGIERRTENLEVRLRRKPGASPSNTGDLIVTVISYGEVTAAGEYSKSDGTDFLGTVGVIRDITLRRKSEDMLRKLYQAVDQLSAGILVADREFRVEYVNPGFFRISGLSPQEVIGADLFSFFAFPEGRSEELRSLVRDGFDARDQARIASAHAPAADHSRGGPWTAIHASPVRNPAGLVTHAIVVCEDISQRKAMEELVTLAKEEADRANRSKSDFLASMSHELKSPVASVLAAARLIEMGEAEPERRAASIIASAQGLLGMLGDILDFVRFETGTATMRKLAFPVASFVLRTCERSKAAAAEKGLAYEVGELPGGTVTTDPDRLARAFGAILDNAVSFTEKGKVRVGVSLEQRAGNVPHLVLTVSDTGVGIPAADQGRIFQPFVQLASPYTKRGGAGIGLSLARNIVRALGGEIRLQSEPGRGSIFTILVPAGEPAIKTSPEAGGRRVYRLLVVDDNEVNLEYMAAILANSGHRTDLASSGADALRALEERPHDAAILDIQMPGMSGIELGAKLRAYVGDRFDPGLPLVALTAFDAEEVLRSGVDFDSVFSKPVDIPKLLFVLDEAIDRREAVSPQLPPGGIRERSGALERARKEVPRLLASLGRAAESGDAETLRLMARALSPYFTSVGAGRAESALRRLVLAIPDEDAAVATCRAERLASAWKRFSTSLNPP